MNWILFLICGLFFLLLILVEEDIKKELYNAALQGDVDAQYKLAKKHEKEGEGISSTYWYRKAAEQGHLKAQYKLKEEEEKKITEEKVTEYRQRRVNDDDSDYWYYVLISMP